MIHSFNYRTLNNDLSIPGDRQFFVWILPGFYSLSIITLLQIKENISMKEDVDLLIGLAK